MTAVEGLDQGAESIERGRRKCDEVPEVRSSTASQTGARRKAISPALGMPRARMEARKAASDSNEVS